MRTRVAAPVEGVDYAAFDRKKVRTMGRVALLATFATERAVQDAGLMAETLGSGCTGLAYGSTHGSSNELEVFTRALFTGRSTGATLAGIDASSYLKFMSHTAAANLSSYFGITGRVITTCSACVSASQAIGYGYEAVRAGTQDIMVCGGAEELHFTHAGVFDILFATSTRYNDAPDGTPRPFDADRDGLVIGEGAATVVLERYDHAIARGAPIYAEILGFGTSSDGQHLTRPSVEGMARAMTLALADAACPVDRIDYINAHGTATDSGDVAESLATLQTIGDKTPISSTKSYTGHTLGACGAIETIFCLGLMREDFVPPTRNLDRLDPRCAVLDYVRHEPRTLRCDRIMNNNFAFGGLNTSLIFGRV